MNTVFSNITPWPGQNALANPRAVIGDNKPPLAELIPQEFRDALLAERADFLTKLDQMVGAPAGPDADPDAPVDTGAVGRCKVTNDDELGRAGDLVRLLRAASQHVEGVHKRVKAPYLEGGRLVDAERRALDERINAGRIKVEAIANGYIAEREAKARAERERIAAEQRAAAERAAAAERERIAAEEAATRAAAAAVTEEERAAAAQRAEQARRDAEEAMAAAALAPAAPAKSEPVRSDAGATVSAKTVWNSQVEDISKAFKAVKSDPKVKEAIEGAVARLVRAGQREIPGTRIWPTQQAIAR